VATYKYYLLNEEGDKLLGIPPKKRKDPEEKLPNP